MWLNDAYTKLQCKGHDFFNDGMNPYISYFLCIVSGCHIYHREEALMCYSKSNK